MLVGPYRSLIRSPEVAAEVGAFAYTPLDARVVESAGYVTTYNHTSVDIGAESATREVVVAVGGYYGGSSGRCSAVTVNGVSLSLVHELSASARQPISLWKGIVATGTSVTVAVTGSISWSSSIIAVGSFNKAATAGTAAVHDRSAGGDYSPYVTDSAITIAADGIGLAVGVQLTGTMNIDWTNMTLDSETTLNGATNYRIFMSHQSTPGSISPNAAGAHYAEVVIIAVPFVET